MRPALNCLMIVFMAACIAQTSQTFAREELAGRRDHHDVFSEKAVAMDSFTPARYQKVLRKPRQNGRGDDEQELAERWLLAAQVDYSLPRTHPPTKPLTNRRDL
ncbi:hypothetical protein KP509_28G006500 [Ceratopteris richardii]|uniref:Uncharacterized protein n=1 Tax=Ceratopteris richardii TaxID=49495 RepID=A0A8T2RB34_CERRI|nr:hypothetical protein KP509_28G006500 [Ceratopteris richardii]